MIIKEIKIKDDIELQNLENFNYAIDESNNNYYKKYNKENNIRINISTRYITINNIENETVEWIDIDDPMLKDIVNEDYVEEIIKEIKTF